MNKLEREVSKLAKLAGKYALRHAREMKVSSKNGDYRNLVTDIDIKISNLLKQKVTKKHPSDIFYSEEDVVEVKDSKRVWSIDPIDGTSNYARLLPHYSSCVSVLEKGEVLASAIFAPALGELFELVDCSPLLNKEKIEVSKVTELKDAYVNFHPGRKKEHIEWTGQTKIDLVNNAKKTVNLASSGLDLCYVACGRTDILIYGTLSTLDVAGAVAILRAAGGEIYNYDTKEPVEFSPEPQRVIATATPELMEDYSAKVKF